MGAGVGVTCTRGIGGMCGKPISKWVSSHSLKNCLVYLCSREWYKQRGPPNFSSITGLIKASVAGAAAGQVDGMDIMIAEDRHGEKGMHGFLYTKHA
jgi:hypothetical protein